MPGKTLSKKEKAPPKPAFMYRTFAVMRGHMGKVYAVVIKSMNKLSGEGSKPANLKRAMKFGEGEAAYYLINRTWGEAQELESKDLRMLIKDKPKAYTTFAGELARYQLKQRRGQDAVPPSYAAVGDSELLAAGKTVPKRRRIPRRRKSS